MTYVATDVYLREHGKLGFVITQTGFQSELGGRAFRQFTLPPDDSPLGLVAVEDMVRLQPFGGEAANRTSVLLIQKGISIKPPIPYTVWERLGRVDSEDTLDKVKGNTRRLEWVGYPIVKTDPLSSWIVGREKPVSIAREFVSPSYYRDVVREGVNTRGANGVFYVERLREMGPAYSVIRNIPRLGRNKKVPRETAKVNSEFLYPLLTGRDVERWAAKPKLEIVLPHAPGIPTNPIPESSMLKYSKQTLNFLAKFEPVLSNRKKFRNFDPSVGEYYGLYNVGAYTFAPYKVVWREIASDFIVAPVLPLADGNGQERIVVPNHKLMMVPVGSEAEALFLAAMLGSTIARFTVLSYTIATQISTHVLNHVGVPQYDGNSATHGAIVNAARRAVAIAQSDDHDGLNEVEREIDEATRPVWKASAKQVEELRDALGEIREALAQLTSDGAAEDE